MILLYLIAAFITACYYLYFSQYLKTEFSFRYWLLFGLFTGAVWPAFWAFMIWDKVRNP